MAPLTIELTTSTESNVFTLTLVLSVTCWQVVAGQECWR